jgi:predicted NBD/HSP70 family sugar kinase
MKSSALQEFLRSLGGSLSAVGVPPKAVEDLRAVARALEPFKDLDLEQLADFLRRAAEFRRDGHVPAVSVAGPGEARRRPGGWASGAGGGADADIAREQKHLQTHSASSPGGSASG